MSADAWQLWQKKTNAKFHKPCVHIERCLYAVYVLTLSCVFFVSKYFFMKVEGTYKFVGKYKKRYFLFLLLVLKNPIKTNHKQYECDVQYK
jgi:uncharacterized membrane protein YozB (DUF420 family)